MPHSVARPLAGLMTIAMIVGIVAFAVIMFRGGFTDTSVPVTVLSTRAGLVMNPDARVQMRGVQVGKVASIEERPDGQAVLHLAMDPSALQSIPDNVLVNIASTTIFGAKFVELIPPADPSPQNLGAGQVLQAEHVTVEINTIFQQLTSMLSKIEPDKLSETLGAIALAFNGRGAQFGRTLSDMNAFLAQVDQSLPNLSRDIAVTPAVASAYADAAPELVRIADNAASVSQTIVDEQRNLDALLISSIGLADIGNEVVGGNQQALTDVLHLLVPTTDLADRYHAALSCGLAGMVPFTKFPPLPVPGLLVSVGFPFPPDRYRFPHDLPRVAATGGPHCADMGLPNPPYEARPPFLVADVGTNPWKYGNQGILLNSDALKQYLYGPIDGPPRNGAQIGQPG
ncbi:MCE family protein [Mycobacterium sp. SMC-2]|uniref:MCE family protein n=1 Tax=Mycobacterium sp. SMC-2 TaxID=2857058 RepID=UPI0021B2C008|nr:MCE family protein [Mycobacterium sp. SMC-2]UXA06158.1 MCE family protein [Mycobacterium sp. SMC-2]